MPRALTVDEAAAELRKTPRWLREWLRRRVWRALLYACRTR
jgi:hypothetical protein